MDKSIAYKPKVTIQPSCILTPDYWLPTPDFLSAEAFFRGRSLGEGLSVGGLTPDSWILNSKKNNRKGAKAQIKKKNK